MIEKNRIEEMCPSDDIIQKIIYLHFKACEEFHFLTKDIKYDHTYIDSEGFKIDYIKQHWND